MPPAPIAFRHAAAARGPLGGGIHCVAALRQRHTAATRSPGPGASRPGPGGNRGRACAVGPQPSTNSSSTPTPTTISRAGSEPQHCRTTGAGPASAAQPTKSAASPTRPGRRDRRADTVRHAGSAGGEQPAPQPTAWRRRPQHSATAAVVAAAAASASRVREVQRPSPRAGPSGCGGRCALRADLDCRAAVHLALPPLLGAGGRGAVQCTHGPVLAGTPGTEWGHNPSWGPADPKGSAVGSSCASSNARLPPRAARTRPTAAPPGPSLRVSLAASSWLREIAAAGHAQRQSAQWTPGRLWVEPALPCYHRPPRAGLHARNFDASIDGFDASNGSSDASNDGFDVSNDSFDASNDGFDASNEGSANRITVSMRRMTVSMSRITVSMRRKKVSRRCKTVAMRRTKVSMRRMKVEALIHYLRPSLFLIDCLVNWILVV